MTDRKPYRESKPKNVIHINGTLRCLRCARDWDVVDLNPERECVSCPVCNMPNGINEARKRAL
jgi:NAD-dependent SIR2 family protein deacetylase